MIGDEIRRLRKKRGLTQSQLAEKLGVSSALISQYELGARTPKYTTLCKLGKALDSPDLYLSPRVVMPQGDDRPVFSWPDVEEFVSEYNHFLQIYESLNQDGRQMAEKLLELLAKVPEYVRTDNE